MDGSVRVAERSQGRKRCRSRRRAFWSTEKAHKKSDHFSKFEVDLAARDKLHADLFCRLNMRWDRPPGSRTRTEPVAIHPMLRVGSRMTRSGARRAEPQPPGPRFGSAASSMADRTECHPNPRARRPVRPKSGRPAFGLRPIIPTPILRIPLIESPARRAHCRAQKGGRCAAAATQLSPVFPCLNTSPWPLLAIEELLWSQWRAGQFSAPTRQKHRCYSSPPLNSNHVLLAK